MALASVAAAVGVAADEGRRQQRGRGSFFVVQLAASLLVLSLLCCSVVALVDDDSSPTKSSNDNKQYRLLTLSQNQLQILLISDPTTNLSAASMSTPVGSFSDDDDVPGLAHFLEHMLFLGTKKYPNETAFDTFLSQHGGESNAYTDDEETNYYFEVDASHFYQALDMFAQFFIEPLFNSDATSRELNAVSSENDKNLNNDFWRIDQLLKSTSNPAHPFHKFGTGSIATLETIPKQEGINVRDRLLAFHNKYYSANILKLVVLGRESLDDLEKWAKEIFTAVPNNNRQVPDFSGIPVFRPEDYGLEFFVVPIKNIQRLEVYFPLDATSQHYKILPMLFFDRLLAYQGPGSLLTYLKQKGWAEDIEAELYVEEREFSMYSISIDLTSSGLNHADEVLLNVFEYIQLINSSSNADKLRILNELKQLADIDFRFQDAVEVSDYVTEIGSKLHNYDSNDCLTGDNIFLANFDLDYLQHIIDQLNPDNMRVHLIAKKFSSVANLTEQWYGTQYQVNRLTDKQLKTLRQANANSGVFALPPPNPYIPSDFKLRKPTQESDVPVQLAPQDPKDKEFTEIWYKHDTYFKTPKVDFYIMFNNPVAYYSPMHSVYADLFARVLDEALSDISDEAGEAGLSVSVEDTVRGFQLSFSGFNDKLSVLVNSVLQVLKDTSFITSERFDLLAEELEDDYDSAQFASSSSIAGSKLTDMLVDPRWSIEEMLPYSTGIKMSDFTKFANEMLSQAYLQIFAHGNILPDEVISITATVHKTLNFRGISRDLLRGMRAVDYGRGHSFVRATKTNPKEKNSAIELYLQFGKKTLENVAYANVLSTILGQKCFEQLRTVEQLGYIAYCSDMIVLNSVGFSFYVQSTRDPYYLDSRIESFIYNTWKPSLDAMSESDLGEYIGALINEIQLLPTDLSEQTGWYWSDILSMSYDFNDNMLLSYVRNNVSLTGLKRFCNNYLFSNFTRTKVSSQVYSSVSTDLYNKITSQAGLNVIYNVTAVALVKRSYPTFALSGPYYPQDDGDSQPTDGEGSSSDSSSSSGDTTIIYKTPFMLVVALLTLGLIALVLSAVLIYTFYQRKNSRLGFLEASQTVDFENSPYFSSNLDDDELNATL